MKPVDRLFAVYAARDRAMHDARQAVTREYAPIIHQAQAEYAADRERKL